MLAQAAWAVLHDARHGTGQLSAAIASNLIGKGGRLEVKAAMGCLLPWV
jgi:hypothetical protein